MRINRKIITSALVPAVLLALAAVAAAQKVNYNFLPGTNFAKYRTYRWVKAEGAQYPSQLLDDQIMRSIDVQLAQKGLTRMDSGGMPDLAVVYQVAIDHETQWNSYGTGGSSWGYGGWRGWGGYGGMDMTTTTSQKITVGTLALDFYDVSIKKQVWRGQATKTLGNPKKPEKLQKNLDKATAKLLKNYPPPAKK
jgi:hypothetical protein